MYNDDYVIMFDENGQPYLEHSIGSRLRSGYNSLKTAAGNAGRSTKGAVKYLLKVPNAFRNGAARYFYTQDEIRAFQREKQANNDLRKIQNSKDQTKKAQKTERAKVSAFVAKKRADEARARVQGERNALADRVKTKAISAKSTITNYGKTTLRDIRKSVNDLHENASAASKKALKWLDDHDAGLNETLRYATQRNKVSQEEKDRLHDEMTATRIGRNASRVGQLPQTVPNKAREIKASAKELSDGVNIYNNWRKNMAAGGYDKVKNNKVASEIDRRVRNAEDALDRAVIKAASRMEGADLYNKHLENGGWEDGEYEAWLKTKHGKFFQDSVIAAIQSNGLKDTIADAAKSSADKARGALKRAGQYVDDLGIDETVRYAANRNRVDQDERDRLHDEMTATPVGRAASKVGQLPQTIPARASEAWEAIGNYNIKYPTGVNLNIDWANTDVNSAVQAIKNAGGRVSKSVVTEMQDVAQNIDQLKALAGRMSGSAKRSVNDSIDDLMDDMQELANKIKFDDV